MKNWFTFKVVPIILLSASSFLFLGKKDGIVGQSKIGCTCHNQTANPNVSVLIKGPGELRSGETANYQVEISGGAAVKGGFNISSDAALLNIPPGIMDTKLVMNEVTHTMPKQKSGDKITFNFNVTAPNNVNEFTLHAAGNSVNGDDLNSGDGWDTSFFKVKVSPNVANPPFLSFDVSKFKAFPNCGDTMFTNQANCPGGALTFFAFTKFGWDAQQSSSKILSESLAVVTDTSGLKIKIDSLELYAFQKINTFNPELYPSLGNLGDERVYVNGVVEISANNNLKLKLRNVVLMSEVSYPTPTGSGAACVGTIFADGMGMIDTVASDATWMNEVSKPGSRVVYFKTETFSNVGIETSDCPNGYGYYSGKINFYRTHEKPYKYQTLSLVSQGTGLTDTLKINMQKLDVVINFTEARFGRDSLPANTNSGRRALFAVTNNDDEGMRYIPFNIHYNYDAPWFHLVSTMRSFKASAVFDFSKSDSSFKTDNLVMLIQRGDSLLPVAHQTYLGNKKIRIDSIRHWSDFTIGFKQPTQINIFPNFLYFGPGPFATNETRIDSFFIEGKEITKDINLSIPNNSAFKFKTGHSQTFVNNFTLHKDSLNKYVRIKFDVQFTSGNLFKYFDSLKISEDSTRVRFVYLAAGTFKDTIDHKIFISNHFINFGPIEPNVVKLDSFRIAGRSLEDSVHIMLQPMSQFKIKLKGPGQFVNNLRLPKDQNNNLKDTTILVQFTPRDYPFEFDTLKIATKGSPPQFVLLTAGLPDFNFYESFLSFNVDSLKASPNCGDTMFTGQANCPGGATTYFAFTKFGWDSTSRSFCTKESLDVLPSTAGITLKIDSLEMFGFRKVNTMYDQTPPGPGNLGDERIYANGVVEIRSGNAIKLRLKNVIVANDNFYPQPIGEGPSCVGSSKIFGFGIIDTIASDQYWVNELSKMGSRVIGFTAENFSPIGVVTANCPNGYAYYKGNIEFFRIPEMNYAYKTISLPSQGSSINHTFDLSLPKINVSMNFSRAVFGRDSLPSNTNSGRRVLVAAETSSDDFYNTPKNIIVKPGTPWFHIVTTMPVFVANATFDFSQAGSDLPIDKLVFLTQRGDSLHPIRHQTYLGGNKIRIDSIRRWEDVTIGIRTDIAVSNLKLNTRMINLGIVKQHLSKDTSFVITNTSAYDTLRYKLISPSPLFVVDTAGKKIGPNMTRTENVKFIPSGLGQVLSGIGIMSNTVKYLDTVLISVNVVTAIPVGSEIPTVFSLNQNYPNPFNPTTTIKYGLPVESNVKIEIFNMLGQKVTELVNEVQSAHYYEVIWDARNISSGMYIYKLEATEINNSGNKFTSIKKMVLVK